MVSLALVLLALACMLLAWSLLRAGRRQLSSEQLLGQLQHTESVAPLPMSGLQRQLLRSGLDGSLAGLRLVTFGYLALLVLAGLIGSWPALAVIALGVPLLLWLWMGLRYRRRVQKMVEQLPALLDHMIRSLKSGRTLADALLGAIGVSAEPLHGALGRVARSVELGLPLGEALDEFAHLYEREEFHILALGVRVNLRYGGSASDLLASLSQLIRDREKGGRQLRAMTGETRITAYVLGGLPTGLAAYIFVTNPAFILGMWHDSAGQVVLLLSALFQVSGGILLWRMMRSIG